MDAAIRHLFGALPHGHPAWHPGIVADRLGLAPEVGGRFGGRCPWDETARLVLDPVTGQWRTEPGGHTGSMALLLPWMVSPRVPPRSEPPGYPPALVFDRPALAGRLSDPAFCRDRAIGWVADPDHPRFGHIALTIFDILGHTVGWSYRRVDDPLDPGRFRPKRPRWSLSPAFPRGRHLYNLDRAWTALASSQTAIVVEGPFDALHLHRAGWPNTVALLGNQLTGWHVSDLLTLGVSRVVLLLDNDHGGRLGRRWALTGDGRLDQFQVTDLTPALPAGCDPDDLSPDRLAALLGPFRPPVWALDSWVLGTGRQIAPSP